MVIIYNSDLSKELREGAKIQTSRDNIPNQLADKVVPVMEVNPKLLRRTNSLIRGTSTTTATLNVLAIDPKRDFFITGYTLSVMKDAASDNISVDIRCTIDNLVCVIAEFAFLTTVANAQTITQSFVTPIKVDKGTNIQLAGSFAAGTMKKTCIIQGYYVDNSLA